jgi:hypothetical protein
MKRAGPSSTNLIGLQRELNRWRRSQPRRTALPEAMWQSAATLAGSEGVSAVARTLRVDPHQLHLLLWNGDPSQTTVAPMWRAVATTG